MAVNATRRHLALEIEPRLETTFEVWEFLGDFELTEGRHFAGQGFLVGWVSFVEFQCLLHGLAETFNGDIPLCLFLTGSCSIPTIQRFIGIHEERGKGEVVIKVKQIQIDGITLNKAHTHELIHPFLQILFQTDNLPVKSGTSRSWNTSERDQQRFAVPLGFRNGQVQIVIDPESGRFDRVLVASDLLVPVFCSMGDQYANEQQDSADELQCLCFHHGVVCDDAPFRLDPQFENFQHEKCFVWLEWVFADMVLTSGSLYCETRHQESMHASQNIPEQMLKRRSHLLKADSTDACRLVHGVADGMPGFYLDRFGNTLLASKEGPLHSKEEALCMDWFNLLGCEHLYLKNLDRQVRRCSVENASPELWKGPAQDPAGQALENGVRYLIRFDEGYSVGIFLDQRENRQRCIKGQVTKGFDLSTPAHSSGEVLNTFSYTCAFSVCIGKAGMRAVSLDLSRKYLDWGRSNFQLNDMNPDDHDFIYGDVFDWMRRFKNRGRKFAGIILDPPTFSKAPKTGKIWKSERDYPELLEMALDLIEPGGWILACNNTLGWSAERFESSMRQCLSARRIAVGRIYSARQGVDFPVTAKSPQYLKSVWIQVEHASR